MKKVFAQIFIFVFLFGQLGVVFAQEGTPTPTPTPSPTPAESPTPSPTPVLTPTPTPETTPTPTTVVSPTPGPKKKKIKPDLACMQNAVDKRDTAIIAAWDKYSAAVKSSLEARRTSLKNAWSKEVRKERRAAIIASWAAYRKAVWKARVALNQDKKKAWTQYRVDRKLCKAQVEEPAADPIYESVDVSI